MKPLPDINNDAAMLIRGKRSAIGAARNDAAEALRDACTFIQGADWEDLPLYATNAKQAADRLLTLAAMWEELK
jgi:hypothetical protein